MDPLTLRRRNVIPDDAYPCAGVAGITFGVLPHESCLRKIGCDPSPPGRRVRRLACPTAATWFA
jgi:carbon-monoxide dehydrogenase large subunit